MITCRQCAAVLDESFEPGSIPFICGGIMGDEYIESWYLCRECDAYTVEIYHDRFLGEDDISLRGPVGRSEGDAKIAIIRRCPDPSDKKCRCEAHRAYFGRWLD